MKKKKKKRDFKKRTVFTIVAIINLMWYTIAVLYASFNDHMVPGELTVAWFSAWTVELALLAGITIKEEDINIKNILNSSIKKECCIDDQEDPSDIQDCVSDYDENGLG